MKQVLQNFRSGQLRVADVPVPACRSGQVLVRNLYSVVSAGTERQAVEFAQKSLLQKARARPDLVRKVWASVQTDGLGTAYQLALSRLDDWKPLGYSSAGRVLQIGAGVGDLSVGDSVACAGAGYANHAEVIAVPRNLVARIPPNVDPRQAAFATLGAIALQGIHRAALSPGECVGVIGLGLLGQLAALMLRHYNLPVLGIDVNPAQVERARGLGLRAVLNGDALGAVREFGEGRGLDAVIVTAAGGGSDAVQLAGELCRERGRVSAVGLVGMDIPRQLYYDKELDFFVSRSYGPGRYDPQYEEQGRDYPLGYVRWTENRNLQEFLRLLASGMDVAPLVTHTRRVEEAPQVYEMIREPRREYFLGVLFEYPAEGRNETRVSFNAGRTSARAAGGQVRLGIIGPGAFARATLLPALRKLPGVSVRGLCSATGRSAEAEARVAGASYCTSDYQEILNDGEIDAVVIATRHNLHARLAVEALERKKHVYVEKPPALSVAQLCELAAALRRHPDLVFLVGYNRRFSPYTLEISKALASRARPFLLHYRVNAGYIEPRSWVQDPAEGGGRIIGEVCHFVDLLQAFAHAAPVQVCAHAVKGAGEAARLRDSVAATLLFADGSIGNIVYAALGARTLAKERIEIFAGGAAWVLDNFRAVMEHAGSVRTRKGWSQDKGHARIVQEFVAAIQHGKPAPISRDDLLLTSLTTFAILESLDTGLPARVSLDALA